MFRSFVIVSFRSYIAMRKIFYATMLLFVSFVASAQTLKAAASTELVLRNSKICLKQDLTRGGAIFYISKSNSDRNVVNIYDEGRYIQQSYYAGKSVDRRADGQSPTWSPWPWNPIQVGDYARNRAQILESRQSKKSSYVKCIPMQWDMNNHPSEAVMEQWVQIKGSVICVKNRLTCHRTDSIYGEGIECDQEIPAVYLISSLKNLHSYFGMHPFTAQSTTQTEVKQIIIGDPEHFWGRYPTVTEQWMAFTDDEQWGVAVYSPSATEFLAGRFGANLQGEYNSDATSYIAPLRRATLMRDSVLEYEYYLIVGTLEQMRKEIYKLNRKLSKSNIK